ncbi:hypothetical protein CLV51_10235 [Chitinophaga niastensis]|uniref:Uncharacterized protein n=1 Tax=Chitinophaga niastensis TaxID=536980 RepID=A0A2P8HLV1_CHINA|nr:hypothetical protein CLV51_10235 [Chitinophaga niastensis]
MTKQQISGAAFQGGSLFKENNGQVYLCDRGNLLLYIRYDLRWTNNVDLAGLLVEAAQYLMAPLFQAILFYLRRRRN